MDMRSFKPFTLLAVPALLVGVSACDDDDPIGPEPEPTTFETSFEASMAEFEGEAVDVTEPQVDWTVERTDARADDGDFSTRISLDNTNDRAKVWIERDFELEPNTFYDVDVSYRFATEDFGTTNLWDRFTFVGPESPQSWDEIESPQIGESVFMNTGNEESSDVGYVWLDVEETFTMSTDDDGDLHLAIGVHGTSVFNRDYFVDDLRVSFEPLS